MEVYIIMIILTQILCDYESILKLRDELSKLFDNRCVMIITHKYQMPWESHILAFINTLKSFRTNTNIARKFDVEYLIRLFNERQINHIMDKIAKLSLNHGNMLLMYCSDDVSDESIYHNILKNGCTIINPLDDINIGLSNSEISSIKRKRYMLIGTSGCSTILS
ncbi:hypothetical protein Igag_0114 [Ignisphaera aggregans DSM 17230]|uniref:Uncharacterized protein n=1 Tax=Ignisphaera aggregans (strain DSM 17230 / JCM 13409 / AQ1.S1) TaxID=583356 RepID=E0SPU4_IGNAA|nr:hypothetical protein Igag_0114 [Ignisphaera aggregans DSM 17230]